MDKNLVTPDRKCNKRAKSMQLDSIHWMILEQLQQNGRISYKEIGKKIGLSAPAVIDRIRKMEESGVIKGYKAVVSPSDVGYAMHVIFFLKSKHNRYEDFLFGELEKIPEILKHWSVTGETDIIIEAAIPDMKFLSKIIEILTHHGQVSTHFILSCSDELSKPLKRHENLSE